MVLAAMPFAVIALGGTPSQIGQVLAAQGVGTVLGLLGGGVAGDRLNRRAIMVAADLARFAVQGVVAITLLLDGASIDLLIALQVLHGVATGFFLPASVAVVPEVVPDDVVQPANGLKSIARSIAGAAGPALGAIAVAVAGPGLAMAADSVSFLGSAMLLAGLTTIQIPDSTKEPRRSFLSQLMDGWRSFWRRKWVRYMTIEFTVINAVVVAPFYVLGPLYADQHWNGATSWALLVGAISVGQFAGGFTAMSWRPDRPLVAATLMFVLWGLPLMLIAAHAPILLILLGAGGAGTGWAVFDVFWETTVQTHIPSAEQSRVSAFEHMGSVLLVPVGFLLGGWLAEAVGVTASLLAAMGVLILSSAAVLAMPSIWNVHRLVGPRDAPAT